MTHLFGCDGTAPCRRVWRPLSRIYVVYCSLCGATERKT